MDVALIKDLFSPQKALLRGKELSMHTASLIYLLVGFSLFVEFCSDNSLGKAMNLGSIYLFCFFTGPLAGLFSGFITSILFMKFSDAMMIVDQNCTRQQVRSLIAYTSIPFILTGFLTTLELFFCGDAVFNKFDVVRYLVGSPLIYFGAEGLKMLILIWVFIIQIWSLAKLRDIQWWQVLLVNFVSYLLVSAVAKSIILTIFYFKS